MEKKIGKMWSDLPIDRTDSYIVLGSSGWYLFENICFFFLDKNKALAYFRFIF